MYSMAVDDFAYVRFNDLSMKRDNALLFLTADGMENQHLVLRRPMHTFTAEN
jgi:hypothetical protein